MKTVTIEGITAKEVLSSLAASFEVNKEENYGEYSLPINKPKGEGMISGINFPNGIGLFRFNLKLNEDYCIDFCSKIVHPFKFIYVIEGSIQHQFTNQEEKQVLEEGQSVILGANYQSGNRIIFSENRAIRLIILDVDRKKFAEQLTFPLEEMDEIYHNIFGDTNAIRTIYHQGQYSLKMAYLVKELDSFDSEGMERTSFHGAKALELLTYMLMLYRDDREEENQQKILRQSDLKKIKNIVNHIDQKINEIENISILAREEGISENKLREGFRILFNDTIYGYIQQRRLEYAMHLLLKSDNTIAEIVYAIGLNSRSHFSKIFKERYGKSPNAFRLNKK
jgi:AraC-like DNA-binding protein